MKRFFICILCLLLAVMPAMAKESTIDDVLAAWGAQDENRNVCSALESHEQMLSPEALFRVLATYCMQVNQDTSWEMMADYEPQMTLENDRLRITVMTHALGFAIVLNAYTGACLELSVDEGGNG